jgi:acyl-CoA synthetase (NDP forming)
MAGERMVWEAFFRQTGVIHVASPDEWMDAILAFAFLPPPTSSGVFVMGIGGGASVVSSDTCIFEGLGVPSPSPVTMEKLRETVPIAGSIAGNPLDDFQASANPAYFGTILDLVYQDPAMGMVIAERLIPRSAFHTFHRFDSVSPTIEQIKRRGSRKPVVFVIDSEGGDPELAAQGATLRAEFGKGGIPVYPSVKRAARALAHLHRYYHRLNRMKAPDS